MYSMYNSVACVSGRHTLKIDFLILMHGTISETNHWTKNDSYATLQAPYFVLVVGPRATKRTKHAKLDAYFTCKPG